LGCLFAATALSGCGGREAGSPDTGSREAVRGYYEALVRKDWPAAYAALHPDSQARTTAAPFARKAEHYRRQIGFEPEQVIVRSCEEHGAEAVAHVVLKGKGPAGARSYKDAVVLRQSGSGWGIVLPPRFGEAP
jgi:hypothetical protein